MDKICDNSQFLYLKNKNMFDFKIDLYEFFLRIVKSSIHNYSYIHYNESFKKNYDRQ